MIQGVYVRSSNVASRLDRVGVWLGQSEGDRVGVHFAVLHPSMLKSKVLHTRRGREWTFLI